MDSFASDCASGPIPNADISGIGVRLSFYIQVFLLGFVCIASDETETGFSALLSLAVTTLAYCIATLSLGFCAEPQISLYDAIIVLYLLEIASMSFAFPLVTAKESKAARLVCAASILGTIATELAILIEAPHFGSTPACNGQLVIGVHKAVKFLPVGRGLLTGYQAFKILVALPYLFNFDSANNSGKSLEMIVGNSRWFRVRVLLVAKLRSSGPFTRSRRERGYTWTKLANFIGFASLMTACAEITRYVNHPQPEDRQWGFGQILPMCLIFLPLKDAWIVLADLSRPRWLSRRQHGGSHSGGDGGSNSDGGGDSRSGGGTVHHSAPFWVTSWIGVGPFHLQIFISAPTEVAGALRGTDVEDVHTGRLAPATAPYPP